MKGFYEVLCILLFGCAGYPSFDAIDDDLSSYSLTCLRHPDYLQDDKEQDCRQALTLLIVMGLRIIFNIL